MWYHRRDLGGAPIRRRGPADGRRRPGPSLGRLLREAFAAPDDPRYWDRLEARIMAGVRWHSRAGSAERWTTAFSAWARAGLAAAGIAAVAAGAAAWTTRDTAARVAYETVVDVPTSLPVQMDSHIINVSEQEATVRYVFSH